MRTVAALVTVAVCDDQDDAKQHNKSQRASQQERQEPFVVPQKVAQLGVSLTSICVTEGGGEQNSHLGKSRN